MSTIPPANSSTGAADPKQAAFNALKIVLSFAQAAMNNPANTSAAQDVARTLWNTTNEQLDTLDLYVFTGNTVSLQAGATEMTPGMTQLKTLQAQISALGNDFKEAASIISSIDNALTELSALR